MIQSHMAIVMLGLGSGPNECISMGTGTVQVAV